MFDLPLSRFKVYFSSRLNIIDACVVIITLVVTMIYTFSDLSGASLIPRYLLSPALSANRHVVAHTVVADNCFS